MRSSQHIPGQKVQGRNPRTLSRKNWDNAKDIVSKGSEWRKGDNYTVPKVRYEYKPVTWPVFLDNTYDGYHTVRSSFIPYVIIDNEKYWVLGSFHDFPKDILMDFGGSCILYDPPKKYLHRNQRQLRHYQHQFGCAMLELNEESKGLLVKPVLKSLGTNEVSVYRGTDSNKREHIWFVMVPLDISEVTPIIEAFPTSPYVLKGEELGPLGIYKESDIIKGLHRTSRNLTDFVNYLRTIY